MSWASTLRSWRESSYLRAVVVLAGGTAVAQAVSVAALPIITRLYTPEDFRILAFFISFVQICSVAACLRLEIAIPMPERDEEAFNLLVLCVALATVMGVLSGTVAWAWLGTSHLQLPVTDVVMAMLILVAVTLTGWYAGLQFWSIRMQRFKAIARTKLVQSCSSVSAQVGLGLASVGPFGLIVGSMLQSGAGAGSLAAHAFRYDRQLGNSVSLPAMRKAFGANSNFPKFSVIESLAQTANLQLPILIIATLPIGPEAGYLILAAKALQIPLALVSSAIAQVFAAAAPSALRDGALHSLVATTIGGLAKGAVGPMIFIGITAPTIFPFVFGPSWARAGDLVLWLSPLFVAHMLAAAIGTTLYVRDRQRFAMVLHLAGAAFRIGAVLLIAKLNATLISQTYALSGFAFYVAYFVSGIRCSQCTWQDLWPKLKDGLAVVFLWALAGLIFVLLVHGLMRSV